MNTNLNIESRVKYPRTSHLPWSPGISSDDKVIKSLCGFTGKEVVVTEKRDGENTTMYSDYIHARSLDSRSNSSRDMVKSIHAQVRGGIPLGWRVCGENLYACHSVAYDNLVSYFEVFNIWDETNTALSWDDTVEWSKELGLVTVPVLYRGRWDVEVLHNLERSLDFNKVEGYVVRISGEIPGESWSMSVAKYVRKGHVQTDKHWSSQWVKMACMREGW